MVLGQAKDLLSMGVAEVIVPQRRCTSIVVSEFTRTAHLGIVRQVELEFFPF